MSNEDNQGPASSGQSEGQSEGAKPVLDGAASESKTTYKDGDWRASLPGDLKSAKSLASVNSVEDLAKGYVNAQSVIGKRFEDLDKDQLNTYYNKMGRPETPDGYTLKAPEGADESLVAWYKKAAHEANIPNDMADAFLGKYNELVTGIQSEQEAYQEVLLKDQEKQLRKDFGPAYEERTELANRALSQFGGEELVEALASAGLQNNPALVKAFAKAGEMLAEGKFSGEKTSGRFSMTSEEATGEITKLRSDPDFMAQWTNPSASKHKEAAERMEKLYKIKANLKSA